MSKYVSDYILLTEYECSCCKKLPLDLDIEDLLYCYYELFEAFKDIRNEWNKPIPISSGYRCERHNYAVGGVPLSAHMFGCALDLDIEDSRVDALRGVIELVAPDLRMGIYPGFIHIDTAYLIRPRVSPDWEKGVRWVE